MKGRWHSDTVELEWKQNGRGEIINALLSPNRAKWAAPLVHFE